MKLAGQALVQVIFLHPYTLLIEGRKLQSLLCHRSAWNIDNFRPLKIFHFSHVWLKISCQNESINYGF